MAKSLIGALALASLPSAIAFRNTSPFFLFSTADLSINGKDAAIAQADTITGQVTESLSHCPSRAYIVVRQDGVSSVDYDRFLPLLSSAMGGKTEQVKSTMAVSQAVGNVDVDAISSYLKAKCGAAHVEFDNNNAHGKGILTLVQKLESLNGANSQVIEVTLSAPQKARAADLLGNDRFLDDVIHEVAKDGEYTVIYTTTPLTEEQANAQKGHAYEMETSFDDAVHMELKRDTTSHKRVASSKQGGLFEKYQYFSPGLFMIFSAMVPLVLILFVGFQALGSLEVSYFAFSKEMGPSAQRK